MKTTKNNHDLVVKARVAVEKIGIKFWKERNFKGQVCADLLENKLLGISIQMTNGEDFEKFYVESNVEKNIKDIIAMCNDMDDEIANNVVSLLNEVMSIFAEEDKLEMTAINTQSIYNDFYGQELYADNNGNIYRKEDENFIIEEEFEQLEPSNIYYYDNSYYILIENELRNLYDYYAFDLDDTNCELSKGVYLYYSEEDEEYYINDGKQLICYKDIEHHRDYSNLKQYENIIDI